MTAAPALIILLLANPPPPTAVPGLIDALGAPTFAAREKAMHDLIDCVSGTLDGHLGLRRGIESKDPEIRWRTGWVMRRLYPCGRCKRAGWYLLSPDDGACLPAPCGECGGIGIDAGIWRSVVGKVEPRKKGQTDE